jgi:antitoxin Phd
MREHTWSLQDAKNRFSAVVNAASRGEPQVVTKHGKPAAIVISAEQYERLREIERVQAPSFSQWLLAMPTDDEAFEPLDAELRDTDL